MPNKPLTDRQYNLLRNLSAEEYTLPGRLEAQSYRKLEQAGYVTSSLTLDAAASSSRTDIYRQAYIRTSKGTLRVTAEILLVEQLNPEKKCVI